MNKEKWLTLLKQKDKRFWLAVVGIAGLLLILFSGMLSGNSDKKEVQTKQNENREYTEYLEEQLEELLCRISGVGECDVLVTLEQGTEYIYATEEKNTLDVSETSEDQRFSTGSKTADEATYILVSTDNGQQPLLLTCISPKVKGVVVVCGGGGNEAVCTAVTKALSTALNIRESCICVVQGNIS